MFYRVVMMTNQPPQGMVWIDGGDVELGQTGIAEPVHTNFISGFWMDATEVTKAKWDEVYNWAITNGYTFDEWRFGQDEQPPGAHRELVRLCEVVQRPQPEGGADAVLLHWMRIYFNLYMTAT